jgi:dTDP-4-dehydrorhamnose 3,5-epimerase-like enzyme
MGMHRENGYSATVEGFFVLNGERIRLAKTNGRTFVVAEPCELTAGTTGQLVVIVDGEQNSKLVTLPDGVVRGQTLVHYTIAAPF